MNTFFSENSTQEIDLFASSTTDVEMTDRVQNAPSVDSSLSGSFSSRFLKMGLQSSTNPTRHDDNKENALKQSSTGIEKPLTAKKKKEKYKPTNLINAIVKPTFSPPRPPRKQVAPLPQPAPAQQQLNFPFDTVAQFSQDYEITCSGNFLMSDLKITENGIAQFPMSFSLSQSQSLSLNMSPSKPATNSVDVSSLSSQSPRPEYVEQHFVFIHFIAREL